MAFNWSPLRFVGKAKEYNQGTKRNVLKREQNDKSQHPASKTLYISTANCREWGKLRPKGNKRKCIGAKGNKGLERNKTMDRSERKQGTGRERRRLKHKGRIITRGEKKECLHQQQAFQIRQRRIRTYKRADKEELMAS